MNKKIAIALVMLNITCLVANVYMGFRLVTASNSTHQSFLRAQERAKLAGAVEAIPRLNSDYIDFLREANNDLLKVFSGVGIILLGNTVWIFRNRKSPTTSAR